MRVALLPTQIEVTIFSFLNGKIFGGPWLNCMLKNTEQGNESRERSIHQRPDYHHSQCIYPFSQCSSTRIERPNLSNFRVFINKHWFFNLAELHGLLVHWMQLSAWRNGNNLCPDSGSCEAGWAQSSNVTAKLCWLPVSWKSMWTSAYLADKQQHQSSILKRLFSLSMVWKWFFCVFKVTANKHTVLTKLGA